VGAAVHWTTKFKQRRRALPRDPLPDHQRVYAAIEASNPSAARDAMSDLLVLALEDMDMSADV
jgi:DNA-binding FadR family transcriptional regulator